MEKTETRVTEEKQVMTFDELSRAWGISRPTIYQKLLRIEGFPALRIGKRWLIPYKAAEKWLEKNIGREF